MARISWRKEVDALIKAARDDAHAAGVAETEEKYRAIRDALANWVAGEMSCQCTCAACDRLVDEYEALRQLEEKL